MSEHYRKKPVGVEAVQLIAGNDEAVIDFLADATYEFDEVSLFITTLEGVMRAAPGDWIIKGVKGEFYSCKPDIFEATYEPAEKRP